MSWERIEALDGAWWFDRTFMHRIVRNHARAQSIYNHARRVVTDERKWWNPFDDKMPSLVSIDVDFARVNADADVQTQLDFEQLVSPPFHHIRWRQQRLQQLHSATRQHRRSYLDLVRDAQETSLKAIRKAVDEYEELKEIAEVVRDTSADSLMVGATALTGGTAAAIVATGAAIKGTAKYQDKGHVGAAFMEATGAIAFHVIKVGKLLTSDTVLVIMKGSYKAATALLAGDDLANAAKEGGLEIVGEGVGKLIKSDAVQKKLQHIALPVATKVITAPTKQLQKTVKGLSGALGKRATKAGLKQVLGPEERRTPMSRPANKGSAIDRATFENKMFLDMALFSEEEGLPAAYFLPFLQPR